MLKETLTKCLAASGTNNIGPFLSKDQIKQLVTVLVDELNERGLTLAAADPSSGAWRGLYCEHHNGHVLMWSATAFIGSAHTQSELWNVLEQAKTLDLGGLRRPGPPEAWPMSPEERTAAIADWLAHNQPSIGKPSKRRGKAVVDLSDLELDI